MLTHPELSLKEFTGRGYSKGRALPWVVVWFTFSNLIFQKWWFPAVLRPYALRLFGAKIGRGVHVRNGVRIHWPWKLTVGDSCWLGEGVWLLNLERIVLGDNVCLSQEAFLCTGSHDRRSKSFEFDNGPITVGDRAWVAARALVLRGSVVDENTVVSAGSVFSTSRKR